MSWEVLTRCAYCSKDLPKEHKESDAFDADSFCDFTCAEKDWLDVSGVPVGLKFLDPATLNRNKQLDLIKSWLRDRHCHTGKVGLLLHGIKSGTGKTVTGTWAFNRHALASWPGRKLAKRVAEEVGAPQALWFNTHRFREQYRRVVRDEAAKADWQWDLAHTRTLFLDDVDKLTPSDGLLELIFGVLDERFNEKHVTIITTNLNGPKLEARWGSDLGPYLVRRLRDHTLPICFDS